MTIQDILDITEPNREDDPENMLSVYRIMDDDGEPEATLRASSFILDLIKDRIVEAISASGEDRYDIWLMNSEVII